MKAPHDAKRLKKKKKKAGVARALGAPEAKFRSTIKGYRPELAMRLFELFSQLDLFGLTGGVGAGAAILTRSRNRVRLWDKQRHAEWVREGIETIPPFDERKLWERTHKQRRAEYQPFFIDGPTIAERVARRSK